MEPQLLSFDLPDVVQPGATHRLACWQWGNPYAARTLVCVHGLTRNGRDFDILAQALAGDYRVLCPDMAGRGESQWLKNPAGYSYPAYVADIVALLKSLNMTQVDWVGTSMGGIIGMMMASAWPGLIRTLVLNDIGCLVSAVGLKRIMSYAGSKTRYATRAEAEVALRERCMTFGIKTEDQWQQFFAHSFMNNPDGTISVACDPMIAANLPKQEDVKDVNLWALWGAVAPVPVLLIRGAESDILTRETALQMKAKHFDLTLEEIPGAGHAPALMDASQVTMIAQWLKKPHEKRTTSFLRSLRMRFSKYVRELF